MRAVILAGGKGTRMGSVAENVPKVMLPICGKPVLEWHVQQLRDAGVEKITMCVGYMKDYIKNYFGNGSGFGIRIDYSEEDMPLGTAGCIKMLEGKLKEPFILIYGDLVSRMDYKKFYAFHGKHGGIATLALHPSSHPYDSHLVEVAGKRVKHFLGKPKPGQKFRNLTNAAVYVLDPKITGYIPKGIASDFGIDTFPAALEAGERINAYITNEFIKDMGTPERYKECEEIIRGENK